MENLYDHQKIAINKFNKYFFNDKNTRGIISMCCGSGKTITFYNILKMCYYNNGEFFFIYNTSRKFLIQQILDQLLFWFNNDKIHIDIFFSVSNITKPKLQLSVLSVKVILSKLSPLKEIAICSGDL